MIYENNNNNSIISSFFNVNNIKIYKNFLYDLYYIFENFHIKYPKPHYIYIETLLLAINQFIDTTVRNSQYYKDNIQLRKILPNHENVLLTNTIFTQFMDRINSSKNKAKKICLFSNKDCILFAE